MTTGMKQLLCDIINSPEGQKVPQDWRVQYSGQKLYFNEDESLASRCSTILTSNHFIDLYGINYKLDGVEYSLDDTGFKKC